METFNDHDNPMQLWKSVNNGNPMDFVLWCPGTKNYMIGNRLPFMIQKIRDYQWHVAKTFEIDLTGYELKISVNMDFGYIDDFIDQVIDIYPEYML